MNEYDVQTFIDAVKHYFSVITGTEVNVGTPYLSQSINTHSANVVGSIAVSGQRRGAVHFSAPTALLRHLLAMHGETQVNSVMLNDCLGEIANTIAGNARKKLGQDFIISTPTVKTADNVTVSQAHCLYIPIEWKNLPCALAVDLDK